MSKNNNSVPDLAARFAAARAVHDQTLLAELQGRGIDISAVNDGHGTDFNHHVRLDEVTNRLILID